MRITRKPITAAKKPVKAGTDLNDMLNAFEDKLSELGVTSKTDVTCSEACLDGKCVPVRDGDEEICYIDPNGVFGIIGETVSLADAKDYWNNNYDGDPVLEEYDSFKDWWDDTTAWLESCID